MIADARFHRWRHAQGLMNLAEIVDAEVQQQLVGGLIGANNNLTSLQSSLIQTLPQLAEAMRPHGVHLVAPVGPSCTSITQFKDTEVESQILEADAEVIRGDSAMEVGPVETYRVNRVREVNVDTGHCILDVDGVGAGLPGKITDPALEIPNNVYTTALNTQEPCLIEAKAIRRAGQIRRLYVSNATF